eukprot:CAMPEP_0206129312 /NCGR_PEP_ID=MMETSP1472-20131121/35730_1 /ASSEMBLY_ACC=CAM_ASM_001108 /TAXON_ID=41880 /ORGANISM="Pycnococcus provasolii, Strain RCC251" /LENGTH=95 /DNA_ID=CAMNT_0053520555 /DNA_START=317 /DNA_END=604 /DNA_ORIENTATION=-
MIRVLAPAALAGSAFLVLTACRAKGPFAFGGILWLALLIIAVFARKPNVRIVGVSGNDTSNGNEAKIDSSTDIPLKLIHSLSKPDFLRREVVVVV